jgi:hypothetical protein
MARNDLWTELLEYRPWVPSSVSAVEQWMQYWIECERIRTVCRRGRKATKRLFKVFGFWLFNCLGLNALLELTLVGVGTKRVLRS